MSDFLSLLRSFSPLMAALAGALIFYILYSSVRIQSTVFRNLRDYMGAARGPSRGEQIGSRLAAASPVSLAAWEGHLRWAQHGGYYPGMSIGAILFNGLLYAAGCSLVFLIHPAPLFLLLPLLGFMYPMLAMRSKANGVRRRVVRALPETAALVAAEVSAGAAPEQALLRAAELPGPLSGLLGEAVSHARLTGRPLFSRKPTRGALVEVFDATGLPALRAFAMQIDEVASKGVDSAELMNDAARSLAREYRERVLTEKEKLGGKLTTAVAFHFFFPAVILILAAFLVPLVNLF